LDSRYFVSKLHKWLWFFFFISSVTMHSF
jgi:hypothetical protein